MPIVNVSPFTKKVLDCIRLIPVGKVATYKQIAQLAGKPHGSRGVAWILHSCSTTHKLPWHRVINSQGSISFEPGSYNFKQQKIRLQNEGVLLTHEGKLNLKKFQWSKKPRKVKNHEKKPQIFGT